MACLLAFACAPAVFPQAGGLPPQQQTHQQTHQQTQPKPAQQPPDESEPPEEDESAAPEKFVLNPLESDRNIRVGNYYWHKGNFRAALGRYERATRYNPSSAEAFFKVGEAEEKLKNTDAAKTAFEKVMKLAPDSKLAHDAKKKIESKS
jgi:tetratricopeptide (TPR) repeat protein